MRIRASAVRSDAHVGRPKILAGIALNESAYNGRAWPWTFNVAGRGFFFRTREDAYRAVCFLISNGRSRLRRWHLCKSIGAITRSVSPVPWDALAPATNIRVAEDILNENYRKTHSAVKAVAYYHSANPAPGPRVCRALHPAPLSNRTRFMKQTLTLLTWALAAITFNAAAAEH